MEGKMKPDRIIEELGGCGRFQIRMNIVAHVIKTVVCFSVYTTMIMSKTPTWSCIDDVILQNSTSCITSGNGSEVNICPKKACTLANDTRCSKFAFEGKLNTIVSEFDLVCGRDYIPSLIMTIQVAGLLAGNLLAGQLADLVGRRPIFFSSLVLIMIFNLVGFLSVNWVMFAVARIFIGIGSGFFLTTHYSILSEFSLAKWRVWIVGFPSWPIEGCLFALCAWLIQDWRYLQLLTCIMSIPCLLAWFVIPESFRWYIGHDKTEKALEVINRVAKYNKRHEVEADILICDREVKKDRKYTVFDLFKTKTLIPTRFSLPLTDSLATNLQAKAIVEDACSQIGLGLVSYGIKFGIQALSGNLFFNFFLFNLVGIPSKAIALWLQNKFGRRLTAVLCYTVVAVSGFVVGTVQTLDAPHRNALTNGFALLATVGVTTAWGPVQTMTIEIYPTVIRNIGFGSLSVMGRIGAMVGPQLVYLDSYIPGLLYYVCGAVAVVCVIGTCLLPETMDADLSDKIGQANGEVFKHKQINNGVI